jgi:hypothetical protein
MDQPMTVRIGEVRFHDWVSLELPGGRSDTFIFRMSPTDGLPPGDYAGVVRSIAQPLRKLRKGHASLWIQVSGEGRWFTQEVRYSLQGLPVPVAVTADSVQPQMWDFSFFSWVDRQPLPRPPAAEPYLQRKNLRPSERSCLQVLAWADCAVPGCRQKSGPAGAKSPVKRTRPDALCWGLLDGHETLFWIEVESGNTSSEILRKKTIRRVNQALVYARGYSVKLVFALLGPPWMCKEGIKVFRDLSDDVAVVVEDWKAFGMLPVSKCGRVVRR